jgi:hypothetical protein
MSNYREVQELVNLWNAGKLDLDKPRESIGTSIYGTGAGEDIAGGIGSVGGLLAGGGGLLKLAGYAGRGLKGAYGAWKGGSGASGAVNTVSRNINPKLLPSSNKPYQLGQGDRLGLPGPGTGRPGQLNQPPNILQLAEGPRAAGPGMGRMVDNIGRNYPSYVRPQYL